MSGPSLYDAIVIDDQVMSGTPVFRGTRVPVQNLFDYIADGYDLNRFLDGFPSVRKDDAQSVLATACQSLLQQS